MAPVNICLKRGFIVCDVIFGILGVLTLAVTLFHHGGLSRDQEIDPYVPQMAVMYVTAGSAVVLSAFGLFGALKLKAWALILFSVGVIILALFSIVTSASVVYGKFEVEKSLPNLVLNETTTEFQNLVDGLQANFGCCGFQSGYEDWVDAIPESCLCKDPHDSSECVEVTVSNGTAVDMAFYKEPCLPYIEMLLSAIFNVAIAILFGYSAFLVLTTGLAIAITCQIRRKTIAPPVSFKANYSDSRYSELSENA